MPCDVRWNEGTARLEVSFSNTKYFKELLNIVKKYKFGFDGDKWVKYRIEGLKGFMNAVRRLDVELRTYGEPAKQIKIASQAPTIAVDLHKDNALCVTIINQQHDNVPVEKTLERIGAKEVEGRWIYEGDWEELYDELVSRNVDWDDRVLECIEIVRKEKT